MSDAWIRAGRWSVVAVALVTAAISYSHIRDLALAHGGDSLTSPLLPLGIDGAVAAMTVFMHQAHGAVLWLARFVLVAAVGMTVACNTAYGAAFGVTGALLWSSPAVLFVGCVEVSVLMVRRTGVVTPVPEPDTPVNGNGHAVLTPGTLPSLRSVMRDHRVGQGKAKEILAGMANGNGRHQ